MAINENEVVDCHMHVGVIGDRWPEFGRLSDWYRQQLTYKIFLLYARVPADQASDTTLHEATVRAISTTAVNRVVCLALDHVYDRSGQPQKGASHVWVANEYVRFLQKEVGEKILFGASVHPFDPNFEKRVAKCVDDGAVLLKWLPSAQQFRMGDDRVGKALAFLAKARGGKPLPLLLHCGAEYAIPTSNEKTWTYDFISWNWLDRIKNLFGKWDTPDIRGTERNLKSALDAGAVIILAHCGLPYFSVRLFGDLLEHSDLDAVKEWLKISAKGSSAGKCYADVSALCTPFRKSYFSEIATLPVDYLLYGSDFPTPAFELYANAAEVETDFNAIMKGQVERVIIPEDNLLDVNYRQLQQAFPGHPLFTNFARNLVPR